MKSLNTTAQAAKHLIHIIPRYFTSTINCTPRFLVPITRKNYTYKVLIQASTRYAAMIITMKKFSDDGWGIDPDYQDYEEL